MNAWLMGRIRFGVFVFNRDLYPWENKAVELLREAGASCLFIEGAVEAGPDKPTKYRANLDRILGVDERAGPAAAGSSGCPPHQPSMVCNVEFGGDRRFELSRDERLRITDRHLEFILFFGAGEAPAGLSSCARLGFWQFTRGTGLSESFPFVLHLAHRMDVVTFGLEQIVGQGQHRRRLANGCFRARGESNRAVTAQILGQASRWPLQALRYLLLNGELPRLEQQDSIGKTSVCSIRLIASLMMRDAIVRLNAWIAAYFILETWTVGFLRMDIRKLLAGQQLPAVALIPRLEWGRYIADPFILSTTPQLKLLVEDYNDFGVGKISEVIVSDPFGRAEVDVSVKLESEFHFSYPFLFEDGGCTYCLPECHQSGGALLYRYEEGQLVPAVQLLAQARVTDGTVLQHDGLYWLFCGLEDDNDQLNLYIFFCKSLTENWVPHPLNPVKTDVRSSRSGGAIIKLDGVLFRPAQDCSRSYGYGLSVSRIEKLSPTCFEETVIVTLTPDAVSPDCKGIHTLSVAGDLIVVDAKFHLKGILPILIRVLRRFKKIRGATSRTAQSASQSA